MSRLNLVLTLAAAALLAPALTAQSFPNNSFEYWGAPNRPDPPMRWHAADTPNQRFPLRVHLDFSDHRYDGFNYRGKGAAILATSPSQVHEISYRCDLTLDLSEPEFEARWIIPGRKLEVLLQKPHSTHTRTCRVTVKG